MPKEFTAIGLKFSEQYSPEVLSALGKAFIKECMQNSINASHQSQRGVKFETPANQEALTKKNEELLEEVGICFVGYLNQEMGAALPISEKTKILTGDDDDEKFSLIYSIIIKAVKNIANIPIWVIEELQELDKISKEENNHVTRLLKIIEILNNMDNEFKHEKSFEINIIDFFPNTVIQTDLNKSERELAFTIIKHLFTSSKLHRSGVVTAIRSYKKIFAREAINELTEKFINEFYKKPLNKPFKNIEKYINNEVDNDTTFDQYENRFNEIDNFHVFINMLSGHLDKLISDWIKILTLNNHNQVIYTEAFKAYLQELTQFNDQLQHWLDSVHTFTELESFAQDVDKLNKEISSLGIDENNSILKTLNYIQRIIEEKITHFEEFAEVYIDFNILFSHVTSENIIYDVYFTNMLPLVKHINILTKNEDVADFFENILTLIECLKLKTPDKEFYQHEISILKSYSNIRDIKSYKVTFQKTEEATTIILANFCEAIRIFFDQYDEIQMSEESTEQKSSSHFNNRYRVFPGSSNDNLPTVKKSKKSSSNDKDEESDEEIKPESNSPPYFP